MGIPIKIDPFFAAALGGLGATLVMDGWALFLKKAFAVPMPNYCFVGRWLLHMPRGVFVHQSISSASRKGAECTVGWIAHYTIGALFAIAFGALATPHWLQAPTIVPAIIFGLITVSFPFFVMHPAFGLGLASAKTPRPWKARLRSISNHLVFGVGLYLSGLVLSQIFNVAA